MEVLSHKKLRHEIQCMHLSISRARVQLCRKLINDIKKLSKKKAGEQLKNEKNTRKIQRLTEEVHLLRTFKPNTVAKFALSHTEEEVEKLRENPDVTSRERALSKMSLHKLILPIVNEFHKKYPKWQETLPKLMEKNSNNAENITTNYETNKDDDDEDKDELDFDADSLSDSDENCGIDNRGEKEVEIKNPNKDKRKMPLRWKQQFYAPYKVTPLKPPKKRKNSMSEGDTITDYQLNKKYKSNHSKLGVNANKWVVNILTDSDNSQNIKEVYVSNKINTKVTGKISKIQDVNKTISENNICVSKEKTSHTEQIKQLKKKINENKSKLQNICEGGDESKELERLNNSKDSPTSEKLIESSDVKKRLITKNARNKRHQEEKRINKLNGNVEKDLERATPEHSEELPSMKINEKKLSSKNDTVDYNKTIEESKKCEDPFFITTDNQKYMTYGKIVEEPFEPVLRTKSSFNQGKQWDEKKSFTKLKNFGQGKTDRSKFNKSNFKSASMSEDPVKLHPSWEAKRKTSGILLFQGKKKSFED